MNESSSIEHYLSLLKSKKFKPSKLIDFFDNLNDKDTDPISGGSKCEIIKDNFNYVNVIVADFGTYETKIGLAYYDDPHIFRSAVSDYKIVGYKAIVSESRTIYPIADGHIDNWNALESIFDYSTNLLHEFPSSCPIVISTPIGFNERDYESMILTMFEKYHVPSFYINNSSVFSLLSYGIETGFSIDVGYESTRFSPVFQGHDISLLSKKAKYGGKTITDLYTSKVVINHDHISSFDEMNIMEDVKRKYSYFALDFEKEKKVDENDVSIKHDLDKGGFVEISNDRFMIPEVFFEPSLYGIKQNGISKEISDIIAKIDIDYTDINLKW